MKSIWTFDLKSSPEELWPYIADTDRFNQDAGLSAVVIEDEPNRPMYRRHKSKLFGIETVAIEAPFEWVHAEFFTVTREFLNGALTRLRVRMEFKKMDSGGTQLSFILHLTPRNGFGKFLIPLQRKVVGKIFSRMIQSYDAQISRHQTRDRPASPLSVGAEPRLSLGGKSLENAGFSPDLVQRLLAYLRTASDSDLNRMRPYKMADKWEVSRKRVLEMCLVATRAGLLEMQWNTICPHCRGAKLAGLHLNELRSEGRCDACHTDFKVDLDRLVELNFRPSSLIRKFEIAEFCTGGPARTEHILMQLRIEPGDHKEIHLNLEGMTYRLRVPGSSAETEWNPDQEATNNQIMKCVIHENSFTIQGAAAAGPVVLQVENKTKEAKYLIVEETPWRGDLVTGVDVTLLQTFRDLFADETLPPGTSMEVGHLAFVFTDLKGSTKIYREVGDGAAFDRVLRHFDILKKAIDHENGAVVKTIGDAVMAVFKHPDQALRAMLEAEHNLRNSNLALTLRAGIHYGPAISVNLNDRIDYFGSSINRAARLEGFSTGLDVVMSKEAFAGPGVSAFLKAEAGKVKSESTSVKLKGFDDNEYELWRVSRV